MTPRTPPWRPPCATSPSTVRSSCSGQRLLAHIRADRVLTHTLIAVGVSLLVIGFMESAVFAMVDAFDKPLSFVGVVVSVQGVARCSAASRLRG